MQWIKCTRKKLLLRMHWRLSTILKTSKKSVWRNVFRYVKVCIFWKCTQYTILWDKTHKFPLSKINGKKYVLFFFRELQFITTLLLIYDFYMSRSTRFVSLKLRLGFSFFDYVSLLLQLMFLFHKMRGLFDFKTS